MTLRQTQVINIINRADEEGYFVESISPDNLQGVQFDEWRGLPALRVDEGENSDKKIPLNDFNILQAAWNKPRQVEEIVFDIVPDSGASDAPTGTVGWFKDLAETLAYLTVDPESVEEYGIRYRYQLWTKATEHNPDVLTEGVRVEEPEHRDDKQPAFDTSDAKASSAADW